MRKSSFTPTHIHVRISYEEIVQRGRDMAKEEKEGKVLAEMDEFYSGESTDNTYNADKHEINRYMALT